MSYMQIVRGWYSRSVDAMRPWYRQTLYYIRIWSSGTARAAVRLYAHSMSFLRSMYAGAMGLLRQRSAGSTEARPVPLPEPATTPYHAHEHVASVEHTPAEHKTDHSERHDEPHKPAQDAPKRRTRRPSSKVAAK